MPVRPRARAEAKTTPPNPISYPITLAGGQSAKVCFTFTPPISQQYSGQVRGVVDARISDRSEENGVGFLELFPGGSRYRLAGAKVLVRVDVKLLELEIRTRRAQNLDRFGDDLLSRAVARQDGNLFRHHAGAASRAWSRSL